MRNSTFLKVGIAWSRLEIRLHVLLSTILAPPVPVVPVPDWINTSLYGLPENKASRTRVGTRYFWGIASVDIFPSSDSDGFMHGFSCDPGSFFNNEMLRCEKCPLGSRLHNNSCVGCSEYELSVDDRSECILNEMWMIYGFVFYLWLAIVILPAGLKLQRRWYVYMVKQDGETGEFIVQLCNKHGINFRSKKSKSYPRIYLYGTGHEVLDRPRDPIHFKVSAEDQLQLLWTKTAPKSSSSTFEPNDKDKAPGNLTEFSKVSGYIRFGLAWELFHMTMCRVPIAMWLAPPFCFAVGTLVLWRIEANKNGNGALTSILSSAFAVMFWIIFILGTRCVWQRSATQKQQRRHQLLNERALIGMLEQSCWEKDTDKQHEVCTELLKLGRDSNGVKELTDAIRKTQSQEAGVSVAYLRSEDFLREVETRCKPKDLQNFDPSFYELKEAFFYEKKDPKEPRPLGKDHLCPRDNRYGCALVDTLPPLYRRQATHYLSWTWKYKLSLVQDALQGLLEMNSKPDAVFLYMCFFVNNQYRILFEKDGVGSSNLEHVFESTLSRIGQMVAILDDWYEPVYLTRIWTIFEQFTAIKLGNVKVTILLPQVQNQSLIEQLRAGEEGIRHVTQCLCKFQSKNATAFSPEDEKNVKRLITSTIGFREVDRKIEQFMLNWVGTVVQEYMRSLMVYVSTGENHGTMKFKSKRTAAIELPEEPDEAFGRGPTPEAVRVDMFSL